MTYAGIYPIVAVHVSVYICVVACMVWTKIHVKYMYVL